MDSITHVVLGAVIGGAVARRSIGRKAYAWGAALSSLPDADVLWASLAGEFGQWTAHRGFTHSLWFAPVAGAVLAGLLWRYYRARDRAPASYATWLVLSLSCMWAHALLDGATAYGTQLLTPFTDHRFSFNAIGIIDPFYTGILALAWLSARWISLAQLRKVCAAALLVSTGYVIAGGSINHQVERVVKDATQAQQVSCYPTLLQLVLRSCLVQYVDRRETIFYSYWRGAMIARHGWLQAVDTKVDQVMATSAGKIFAWFTNDQWLAVVEPQTDGRSRVIVRDLRYVAINDPGSMMWGLEAWFDASGQMDGAPRKYKAPPREPGRSLSAIWQAAFGDS
jgi:inner membrane protein